MGAMKIPLINESGEVIGSEERSIVHKEGLLHPEVFVLLRLPNGKFVFQKRSITKDTNPGMMTFSVSGHIEIGETPIEGAIKELKEEAGIIEKPQNLIYLGKVLLSQADPKMKTVNNSLRYFFGYNFTGQISDLIIEPEDGAGFEAHSIEEIKNLNEEERKRFVKSLFVDEILEMFNKF